MDRTERFYKIDSLLQVHRVVPLARMLEELGVSLATFKRDLEYLRDRLKAPIVWDRDAGGYRYANGQADRLHLPGLWLNASEAYALLLMHTLLADIQPGLLGRQIEPLRARLEALIEVGRHPAQDVLHRIRVLHVATRAVPQRFFERVAGALLQRQRLRIRYFARGSGQHSERVISPQLLIHHRGNWYLLAWCHRQQALRSFALDAIEQAETTTQKAREVARATLDAFIGQGYGIFSGSAVQWARLRFSAERTRWVQQELWHPQQKTSVDRQGRLTLELPYTDPRELLMDVLRHGRHVEVLAPAALRRAAREELHEAISHYRHQGSVPRV